MTLTNIKSVWYVDSMNTEILWSANGAMTDFAIFVTPIGWELVALPPPDTTLRANHVASATLRYSDSGSSETDKHRKTECQKRKRKKKRKKRGTWAMNVTLTLFAQSIYLKVLCEESLSSFFPVLTYLLLKQEVGVVHIENVSLL